VLLKAIPQQCGDPAEAVELLPGLEIRGEDGDLAALLFDGFDDVVDVEFPVAVALSLIPEAVVKDQQFLDRAKLGGLLDFIDPVGGFRAVGDPFGQLVDGLGLAGDPGFVLDVLDRSRVSGLRERRDRPPRRCRRR